MAARWRLNLHGAAQLLAPGAEPPLPLARKDAGWLACVALEGAVPAVWLAALLWPDAGERGALNNLRQRVHRLRKASGARLVEMAETVTLAEDLHHSLPDLVQRAAAAVAGGADPDTLLQGLDFDDAGEFAAWLASQRERQLLQWRDALAQQAAADEAAGRLAAALAGAQRLLAQDRLSEHAHRRLMRLHYLRGDRAAALVAFETCERWLRDELGVRPGAETLALLHTVEQARPPLPAAAGGTPVPAQLLRPPRTVGRASAAAALADAHAAGDVPVLVAEAGLGKSRLLQDFAAAHPQAMYTQARPSDAGVPYAALARLLRAVLARAPQAAAPLPAALRAALASVVPELAHAGVVPAAHGSGQLQAAVAALLAAAAGSGHDTVIVDDLHFADRASLELLRALLETPQAGLRWALAHRPPAGGGADDDAAALLPTLAELPTARWITLAPLDAAALHELLLTLGLDTRSADALLPALQRHAGGNPLYLLETLRAMPARDGVPAADATLPRPEGIARLLDRRIDRLSREALALARVAAVAVPDFAIELAEQALQVPPLALADAWRELEAADVLRGEAFAHDLVHDAVVRATPAVVAARVHRQVAAFLARGQAEPARIARHWQAGGDAAQAALAYEHAAQRAEQASRPLEQARLLLQAAAQWQAAGDAGRALLRRADAVEPLIVADGLNEALEVSTAMVAADTTPEIAARLLSVHATALVWAGRSADAEVAAQRALAHLDGAPLPQRAKAQLALGMALANQSRMTPALDVLRPLWMQVEALPDPGERVDVCGAYGLLMAQLHRNGEGLDVSRRQLHHARLATNRAAELNALLSVGFFAVRRGELAVAIEAGEQARQLGQVDRELTALARMNDVVLGDAYVGAGRYADGLALLEAALAHAERHLPDSNILALTRQSLANTWLQLGRPELAQRLAQTTTPGSSLDNEVWRHTLLAQLLERQAAHDSHAVLAAWEQAVALAGTRQSAPALLAQLALARAEGGSAGLARTRTVLTHAEATEQAPLVAAALVRRVAIATADALEDPATLAAWAADAAQRALQHRSSRVDLPALLLDCGRAWQALGRADAARQCWQQAWQWIETVAGPQLPPSCRSSFFERNPGNAALRRALGRAA